MGDAELLVARGGKNSSLDAFIGTLWREVVVLV